MTEEKRCKSPFCIVRDGVRGRLFTPPENAESIALVWCENCLKISNQVTFFTSKTANMIRGIYQSYNETELPKEVKLFMEAYTREIMKQLGEEL